MLAQNFLAVLGYNPGPADGAMGPKTRAAIRLFQAQQGLNLLLINCMKRFGPIHRGVRAQGWGRALEELKDWDLEGKMTGLVDLGHINLEPAFQPQRSNSSS